MSDCELKLCLFMYDISEIFYLKKIPYLLFSIYYSNFLKY